MSATALMRLTWKEYRAIRAFWLAVVGAVVFLQGLSIVTSRAYEHQGGSATIDWVFTLALGAPAFFAVGCAGAAFSQEREEGTFHFLRAIPVSSASVLLSKLSLAVAATAVMFGLLWCAALLWTVGRLPEADMLRGMLGLWPLAAIEGIVWGTLFSLWTRRPVAAICLALVAASSATHLLAWSTEAKQHHEFALAAYRAALPWRALVVLAVAAIDVVLGLRWLHGESRVWRLVERIATSRRDKVDVQPASEAVGDAVSRWVTGPDRSAMAGHLLWQHWRQSRRLMFLLASIQIFLCVPALFGSFVISLEFVIAPMAAMTALMGSCVFLADKERNQLRFFVEHNVPPRYVWLTRQAVWVLAVAASTSVVWLAWLYRFGGFRDLNSWEVAWRQTIGGMSYVGVSYAAGQWASMLVRSGIMAGFWGLLLGAALCVWTAAMSWAHIAWWWSVAPVIAVLLWATWLRAPDWAREDVRWRSMLRAVTAVLVPAIALACAVAIYRVYQVPLVSAGFWPTVYPLADDPEAGATAALYRAADAEYVPASTKARAGQEFIRATNAGRAPSAKGSPQWLADNAEALSLVLRASSRPTCWFGDPRQAEKRSAMRNADDLIHLVLISGGKLTAEGQLDEAIERYWAVLRMVDQLSDPAIANLWSDFSLDRFPSLVFAEVVSWGAQPGQSRERIVAAIDHLREVDDGCLRVDDWIKANYVELGQSLNDNSELIALRLLPWERVRAERLLTLTTANALARIQVMRRELEHGVGVVYSVPPTRYTNDKPSSFMIDPQKYDDLQRTTFPNLKMDDLGTWAASALARFEMNRRSAMLLLALMAYRLEHGELPGSQDELLGAYFDELPRDPYSGRKFVYFREGLPAPRTELEGVNVVTSGGLGLQLTMGQPGIWCTGQNLFTRPVTYDHPMAMQPDGTLQQAPEVVYYVSRIDPACSQCELPTYQAWAMGNWFSIPRKSDRK